MVREHRVPPSLIAPAAFLALLTADVLAGGAHAEVFAVALLAAVFAICVKRLAKSWAALIASMVLVVLLIPNNGSYTLPKALPFQLEPYRFVVGLLLIGWILSLLIDPRVRARASSFDKPLLFIIGVILASDLANPGHIDTVSSFVVKALWLFFCLVLFYYLVVSVVHTRKVVERIITVLVSGGCVMGLGAIVQQKTGYNVFDHLHKLLPMFTYNSAATAAMEVRLGHLRAVASAGNPIEMSTVMAMLVPFAIYLAITRRQRLWWFAAVLLLLADFTGGSRTGLVGVLVILAMFLWLRPRQTLRCWPALIPVLAVVHVAAPGAIGGAIEEFFPKGGIVHQQSETEIGPHGEVKYSSRLSRIGPELHEYLLHDPLLGQGYGSRVTGLHETNVANAIVLDDEWLDTLLETGALGILAWLSLFALAIRRLSVRAKIERDANEGWLPVVLAASIATYATSMIFFDAFGFVQATFLAFTILALAAVVLRAPSYATSAVPTGRERRATRGPIAPALGTVDG